MLIIERGIWPHLKNESQFTWHSYDPSDEKSGYSPVETVTVHPWHRYKGEEYESREVAVCLERGTDDSDTARYEIVIADRDEFVTGLLAVFPELQRNPDYER